MNTKTWTLILTPRGEPASTLTGVSHATMVRSVYDLMHGDTPAAARPAVSTDRSDLRDAA